jgi:hypothetical protein
MADKSYKERLIELRNQLTESTRLGLVNPELFQQQLIQILNGIESNKQKSLSEIERLTSMLGEERGRVKACNDMGDLLVNIVAAFVNQENNRLVEEARMLAEKEEREAFAATQQNFEESFTKSQLQKVLAVDTVITPEILESTKAEANIKLPPGVNFIKSSKKK